MESKHKHLEFIQAVISRMAGNSFFLKGWTVTLVAALFALSSKDANPNYVLVAYLPIVVFWALDGYFLYQERLFRGLYDHVRQLAETKIDFSMDTRRFQGTRNSWLGAMFSSTLLLFYLPLIILIVWIMYVIR